MYELEVLRQPRVYEPQKRSPVLRLKVDLDPRRTRLQSCKRRIGGFPSPGECDAAIRRYFREDSDCDVAAADLDAKFSPWLGIQDVRYPKPHPP
jgi:hypothetical protein